MRSTYPEEYERRVVAFFCEALLAQERCRSRRVAPRDHRRSHIAER
jgi:hypothetical protein